MNSKIGIMVVPGNGISTKLEDCIFETPVRHSVTQIRFTLLYFGAKSSTATATRASIYTYRRRFDWRLLRYRSDKPRWWQLFGVAVTELGVSTKLLHVQPG